MTDEPPGQDRQASRSALLQASPPIFRSGRLDRLTRVHPATPPLVFGPAIVLLAVISLRGTSLERTTIAFVSGWIFWTLAEYWTHRTVFHFEPKHPIGARLHWMIHGVHHDHPNDRRRLVLPPVVSVPLGAAFLGLFLVALGAADGWAVCAGFYSGYLAYDMVHFALHHHRPKSRLARLLHQLHMRHHFEDEHRGFGVSAPWWDLVFGTYSTRARRVPREADAARSDQRN
ncbi:MAG TPA: sterol desaturase family protein [Gaiellales bacterium]|nr:sterol desaturase family protein [Gaiellales bacterium]